MTVEFLENLEGRTYVNVQIVDIMSASRNLSNQKIQTLTKFSISKIKYYSVKMFSNFPMQRVR